MNAQRSRYNAHLTADLLLDFVTSFVRVLRHELGWNVMGNADERRVTLCDSLGDRHGHTLAWTRGGAAARQRGVDDPHLDATPTRNPWLPRRRRQVRRSSRSASARAGPGPGAARTGFATSLTIPTDFSARRNQTP